MGSYFCVFFLVDILAHALIFVFVVGWIDGSMNAFGVCIGLGCFGAYCVSRVSWSSLSLMLWIDDGKKSGTHHHLMMVYQGEGLCFSLDIW